MERETKRRKNEVNEKRNKKENNNNNRKNKNKEDEEVKKEEEEEVEEEQEGRKSRIRQCAHSNGPGCLLIGVSVIVCLCMPPWKAVSSVSP